MEKKWYTMPSPIDTLSSFNHNLSLLEKKAPLLAMLFKLSPSSCRLDQDEADHTHAISEQIIADNPVSALVLGLDKGILYTKLKSWLHQKESRKLCFFFEDLHSLFRLLNQEDAQELIEAEQVHLFYTKAPQFWEQYKAQLLQCINYSFNFYPLKPPLSSELLKVKEKTVELCLQHDALMNEYLHTSPHLYQNLFANLKHLPRSIHIEHLKDQFQGIPALICAAGPSIHEALPFIHQHLDKALIFAGGRSLGILSKHGIEPHFSVGIDPFEMHVDTFSQLDDVESPLIYRMRMHRDAVSRAQGPLIYVPKTIGYPLSEAIEKQLKISSPLLDEGLNVVNFSIQLAHYMGCQQILLAGSDLCYQNGQAYSASAHMNQKLPDVGAMDESEISIHRGYYAQDYEGQAVYTLWKWQQESQWITDFLKKHPNCEIFSLNPKGLKIEGVKATTPEGLEHA